MSESLSSAIEAIRARHPEACTVATSMMDLAALHQRIAELESELAAFKAADEQRFSKALDVADEDWQADKREIYDLKVKLHGIEAELAAVKEQRDLFQADAQIEREAKEQAMIVLRTNVEERDAWRRCAERLVREIVPFSADFHGRYGYEHCNAKEALSEFDRLQALHP